MKIPIYLKETFGRARLGEPLSISVPIEKGVLLNVGNIGLFSIDDKALESQVASIAVWPDRSIKWLLVDFKANIDANSETVFYLKEINSSNKAESAGIVVTQNEDEVIIDTGCVHFTLGIEMPGVFRAVEKNGLNLLDANKTRLVLMDDMGIKYLFKAKTLNVETRGSLRTTVRVDGHIISERGAILACITMRLHFFYNKGLVRLDCIIRNPKRSMHPGGHWDLGDRNSLFFKDLSLHIAMFGDGYSATEINTIPGGAIIRSLRERLEIYQDSSGGSNWNSPNHVNHLGALTNSFCGYKVFLDKKEVESGKRAEPSICLKGEACVISGAVRDFWQNFPKAIEGEANELVIRLFPKQHNDNYELQPGEQKTHAIFIDFTDKAAVLDSIDWIHIPLIPKLAPEYYAKCNVFDYFVTTDKSDPVLDQLVKLFVNGPRSYIDRREDIDEYGWRNYGDIYADHEIVHYKDELPLISHYNNQYDLINGAIFEYARTGDEKWFRFMTDMARHVIDIDIYHTSKDKSAYNGGLFWHTSHYNNVGTATHRCYTKKYRSGGGPSNEHNYTTGLLKYYYLTGNEQAREAVVSLADWVINMDDGKKTLFRFFDIGPTGLSSRTASNLFHGPGRGAGNSINALIDAYSLTADEKYIKEADKLIKRCVHPADDPEHMDLRDPEKRWSYLIFFQVLGKYLDVKEDIEQKDFMYCYARKSLLKYAFWMTENEYIYLDKPERLEYPTETWAAHEMRKANVLLFATKYSDVEYRDRFYKKAAYFYEECLSRLYKFSTRDYVRPIAILLSCGTMFKYFEGHPGVYAGPIPECRNLGQPALFTPQKIVAVRRIVVVIGGLLAALTFLAYKIMFSK